jgi:hypothetical protein
MAYIFTSMKKAPLFMGREQPIFMGEQEDRCFFCNGSLENKECLDIGQAMIHLEVCHGDEI